MLLVGCGVSDVKVAQIASRRSPNAGISTEKTEINEAKRVFFITNPYDLNFFLSKQIMRKYRTVRNRRMQSTEKPIKEHEKHSIIEIGE